MRLANNVLSSSLSSFVVVLTSSSSSLLSITGDLATSLFCLSVVMLVAGGVGVTAAANYSISDLQSMMQPGGRRSNSDLHSRLGLLNGPSDRQLSRDLLLPRLGTDFDADWMSIDQPSAHTRSGHPREFDAELMEDLRELNFSYEDERGDRRTMPAAVRGIFERWLLQRASCPVRYTWEDMGVLFWPRWIKHGYCDTDIPCSWPPGMRCAPAESDTLKLLHWQCRRPDAKRRVIRQAPGRHRTEAEEETQRADDRKNRRSQKMQCRWKKVPYPVTSECFCSC